MSDFKEIPSSKFVWEKYISKRGFATHNFYNVDTNRLIDCTLIGYCPAKNLPIRPRPEGIAVLVIDNDSQEETWFHLMGLPNGYP